MLWYHKYENEGKLEAKIKIENWKKKIRKLVKD